MLSAFRYAIRSSLSSTEKVRRCSQSIGIQHQRRVDALLGGRSSIRNLGQDLDEYHHQALCQPERHCQGPQRHDPEGALSYSTESPGPLLRRRATRRWQVLIRIRHQSEVNTDTMRCLRLSDACIVVPVYLYSQCRTCPKRHTIHLNDKLQKQPPFHRHFVGT